MYLTELSNSDDYKDMNLGLCRMSKIFKALGDPQDKIKTIHIAGTNGKGTVSRLLHHFLSQKSFIVGLYTSPHLVSVEERIQINKKQISKADFKKYKNRVLTCWQKISAEDEQELLTLFEQFTAMAFLYFAEQKVDYAIIETGIGGRLDATNVINPILSIITNISYDHQDILGDTIAKIAYEKAGIIKKNIPVIAAIPEYKDAKIAIEKVVEKNNSELTWVEKTDYLSEQLKPPVYLSYNLHIAIAALKYLNIDTRVLSLKKFINPGRLQLINKYNCNFLLDGAHNVSGAIYLANFIRENLGNKNLIFIVAIIKRKNAKAILEKLSPLAQTFIFTEISGQDTFSAKKLSSFVSDTSCPCERSNTLKQAIKIARNIKISNKKICITGSLFLVGEFFKEM